jgi:DNA-binding NtrC family response regulator
LEVSKMNFSILIVDDEKNVVNLLEKMLKKQGYTTYCAYNGKEALDIIDINQIDLVISDIRMPEIDGISLLKKVKEVDPAIEFMLITAFATVETAVEALRIGARDYIIKPFNLEDITAAIDKITKSAADEDIQDVDQADKNETYLKSESPKMIKLMELIRQVADTRATVMIYGETGTGKELAAKALHTMSSRRDKPFIKVNCAAIPENLLESELFGYEKGAFTGAVTKKPGRFDLADGGSIFLDEIGDVSAAVQVKLLRVLQEREFEHLGGTKTIKVDVRIIAASNKDLQELVKKGEFREDLFYRLNVVPVSIPPLRERKEDISSIADDFLMKSASISGKAPKRFSEGAIKRLKAYNWPGNIRELENIVERCVVITSHDVIDEDDLPAYILNPSEAERGKQPDSRLEDKIDSVEKDTIVKVLGQCGGNRTKAAQVLGISRRSLHRKLSKYSIE